MSVRSETYTKRIIIVLCLATIALLLKSYLTKSYGESSDRDEGRKNPEGLADLEEPIDEAEGEDVSEYKEADLPPDERLRRFFKCGDRVLASRIVQRGAYWAFVNWVRAEHEPVRCHQTITLTTHGDYTFISNLQPMVERWLAPVSIALYAPGHDLQPSLTAIRRMRACFPLVKKWVTFHAFFHQDHVPTTIPNMTNLPEEVYNCAWEEIDKEVNRSALYKDQKKLLYPVNVARNIARDAALTHLVLPLDIELYPNPGLVDDVLQLIARDPPELHRINPYIFSFPEYEIKSEEKVPLNKTELQRLIREEKAFPFHVHVCALCHNIPLGEEWAKQSQTEQMEVLGVGKRSGLYKAWEAIHIGPRDQLPPYDERLSWEGKRDKMAQGYVFCVRDYDFLILSNAFVTHRPGIKVYSQTPERDQLSAQTNLYIANVMTPEFKILYGTKDGCEI